MRQSFRPLRTRTTLGARVLLACAIAAGPTAAAAQAPRDTMLVATAERPAVPETPANGAPATTTASGSVLYVDPVAGAHVVARPAAEDRAAAATEAARMERRVGAGQNAALMIVGAAGIVTGALVGGGAGTAIAVGGAVVGLYGLYRFMR